MNERDFYERFNTFDNEMDEVRRLAFCCAGFLQLQQGYQRILYCKFCMLVVVWINGEASPLQIHAR